MSPVTLALLILIILLAMRNFLVISADFRQRWYHKLSKEDIAHITQQPQKCKFTIGGTALKFQDATITLSKDAVEIVIAGGETKRIKLNEIAQAQSPHPGKLLIFPADAGALDFGKRWFIYFGENSAGLLSGTMPFFWQPPWLFYAGELRAADKKSIAFCLKLEELTKQA